MKGENNEKALIKGLAQNDKEAIETIYRENYNMIQAMVLGNNGTAEDAKDIFQETMIIFYEKVQSGSFELSCLIKTFLYSISRRLWLKRLIQINRMSLRDSHEDLVSVENELEEQQNRDLDFVVMEKAFDELGEPCRTLLEAFYHQKKSMVEIAHIFGYTNAENAKNQKYKCLIRLKKIFFAQYKNQSV